MTDDLIVSNERDAEYVVADGQLAVRQKQIKTNKEMIGLLAEMDGVYASNGAAGASKRMIQITQDAITHFTKDEKQRAMELIPVNTIAQLAKERSITPREALELEVSYISEDETRQGMLLQNHSVDKMNADRWARISNQVALTLLLNNAIPDENFIDLLDNEIANCIPLSEKTNPNIPFLHTMLQQYKLENEDVPTSAGALINWARRNHPEMILDAAGESCNSISQMLLNAQELLRHEAYVEAGVEAGRDYSGGFPDVTEEPEDKKKARRERAARLAKPKESESIPEPTTTPARDISPNKGESSIWHG